MQKILIANRGEIAVRVIRTCRDMGINTVAVYSEADREALHVQLADEAYLLGPAALETSYLDAQRILSVARDSGARGVHPGYGFLSENADFAAAVIEAGLIWVGPPVAAMKAMSSKVRAREIACLNQVPVVPGLTLASEPDADAIAAVAELGFPLLVKASAGGGGIGMRELHDGTELESVLAECGRQAARQFGDATLLIERLVCSARHVEVQVAGDMQGSLVHLFDRDCSAQRRRQKLLEEAPAPDLAEPLRVAVREAALRLAAAVGYYSVGTVEFLVQGDEFYLLEMNTRLQVEHGATEAVTGLDLVQLQINIANGQELPQGDISCKGHAIEARLYAENPARDFSPSTGPVVAFHSEPREGIRLDTGIESGSVVSHYYDGLLCKLIAHGKDRAQATALLQTAIAELCLAGPATNQQFLQGVLRAPAWSSGAMHTLSIEQDNFAGAAVTQVPTADLDVALVAATIWRFLVAPPAADTRPWPGGFALLRSAFWKLGERSVQVDWRWQSARQFFFPAQNVTATVAAGPTGETVAAAAACHLDLEIAGRKRAFECYTSGSRVWVWEAGIGTLLLEQAQSEADSAGADSDGHCESAGPGLVLRVLAEPGQAVVAGDALLVLESMKMESTLRAAAGGVVSEVHVEPGVLVETGQRLLTIEIAQEPVK